MGTYAVQSRIASSIEYVFIGFPKYHVSTTERDGTHAKDESSGSFPAEKEVEAC